MSTKDDQRSDLLAPCPGYAPQRWSEDRPAAAGRWGLERLSGTKRVVNVVTDQFEDRAGLWVEGERGGYWPVTSGIFNGCRWAGPLPELPDAPDAER